MTRSRFTLVHGHKTGKSTNTETSDKTTNSDLIPLGGSSDLHDDTDHVDDAPECDGLFSSESVCQGTGSEGTNHSSDRHETNNQTRTDVAKVVAAVVVLSETHLKVGHGLEARDLSCYSQSRCTHTRRGDKPVEYPKIKPPMDAITPMIQERHVK